MTLLHISRSKIAIEYVRNLVIMLYLILYFREKLLRNVEVEKNYNLLQDIYETLNYDCGKMISYLRSNIYIYKIYKLSILLLACN